jgi:hypothetical protein
MDEAHHYAVMAAIQYSEKKMREMNFLLTLKAMMMIAFPSIRTLQRPPSS